MKDVTIATPNGNVAGSRMLAGAPSCVLILHGFASSRNSGTGKLLSKKLTERGIGSLRIDFNGCGNSYGEMGDTTVTKMLADAQAALEMLVMQGKTAGIYGSSMGGMVALLLAANNPAVKALALRAPVSDFAVLWGKRTDIGEWRKTDCYEWKYLYGKGSIMLKHRFYEDGAGYDVYKSAENIGCPALLMHGLADDVVPPEQSMELSRHIKTVMQDYLPGEGHQFDKESYFDDMAEFFKHALSQS